MSRSPDRARVQLFVTCVVDQFFPEVGEAVVSVLRDLDTEVEFDPSQTCCGQPAFNSGFWNEARPVARRLLGQLDASVPVVVPSGSCAAMIRNYYRELFEDDPVNLARVNALAPNVYEFSEYVADRIGLARIECLLQRSDSEVTVTFHESCHAKRELGIDRQPKSLIDAIPGLRRVEMEQAEVCCGFGGTFAVKYADISGAMLRDKLDAIEASGADVVTACDTSCLMHILGGLQRRNSAVRTAHVAELIAQGIKGA